MIPQAMECKGKKWNVREMECKGKNGK